MENSTKLNEALEYLKSVEVINSKAMLLMFAVQITASTMLLFQNAKMILRKKEASDQRDEILAALLNISLNQRIARMLLVDTMKVVRN
ncbi:hypothetical protein TSUD_258170 [Trifolium subterraneum]|uniref:Uncharacterized protein n=1 Tax=Trifolium subterraneum TaxID=3900 RepID=A0A2Z6N549_TRISU|nr:hypothetical protein TSUD_258170 [Trifolium subterraneum]